MSKKSDVLCKTSRCIELREKYAGRYLNVYEYFDEGALKDSPPYNYRCEGCGGTSMDGEIWEHVCKSCGITVEPGELCGLFVPHVCKGCEKKTAENEIKRGAVCGMCRKPFSRCCC